MPDSVVLLVNPNRMNPPIGPLGLEYIAAALTRESFATGAATGNATILVASPPSPAREAFTPVLCDLAFAQDWEAELERAISSTRPEAIGVSLRNIDDAYFASQDFVLERTAAIARRAMELTPAPVILGGIGFSCAPSEILSFTGARYGIAGDGQVALPRMLRLLRANGSLADLPGAVYRDDSGAIIEVAPAPPDIAAIPAPSRRWSDNARYFAEGGQAGIETKSGCPQRCLYCPEPHAKGSRARLRSPQSVVDECRDLLDQGVDVLHLCDSEFNLPPAHARAVCEALIASGLGERLQWYAYNAPEPFDADLARLMARAGCAGINFGVDHADEAMLRRLGRAHGPESLRTAAAACHEAGIAVMFDFLLGAPGETRESIARAIDAAREANPDRAGLSCGVRVYPRTPLAALVRSQGPLSANPNLHGATQNNDNLLRPIFYVDRALATAIRNGARGAYWDILRRMSGDAKKAG
ncbi:MAG: B12-binding domain-containing radical SAM protein [Candidatus Sumerlaeota bacterium]|nr:B12-binding domain-containing radical SAM protein [Candidatus Sumerlaeota bacterium]